MLPISARLNFLLHFSGSLEDFVSHNTVSFETFLRKNPSDASVLINVSGLSACSMATKLQMKTMLSFTLQSYESNMADNVFLMSSSPTQSASIPSQHAAQLNALPHSYYRLRSTLPKAEVPRNTHFLKMSKNIF
jgi:hypothetical protein